MTSTPAPTPLIVDEATREASIASGSFQTLGMMIVPCSVKTMSEIAHGVTASRPTRAADVTGRSAAAVCAVRDTPLHLGHHRTTVALTERARSCAAAPRDVRVPKSVEELVEHSACRWLTFLAFSISWPRVGTAAKHARAMGRQAMPADTFKAPVRVSAGDSYAVEAAAAWVGGDLLVWMWGGDRPHIGAVAAAHPRPSLPTLRSAAPQRLCLSFRGIARTLSPRARQSA